MKNFSLLLLALVSQFALGQQRKAPAYPLITHNPYFSIWSTSDKLFESTTTHWTGAHQSMLGFIKVDGKVYRFMGKEAEAYKTILPAADETNYAVKYTETQPRADWTAPGFNDNDWKNGKGPAGDDESKDKIIWKTKDIWIRRVFAVPDAGQINQLILKVSHDDDVEVYLNGERVYQKTGVTNDYGMVPIANTLKSGENVLAVHVINTGGGARADFGLADIVKDKQQPIDIAEQRSVDINATQTIYSFKCGKADLQLTFTSPLLITDLALLSKPVSYITYRVKSNDGKPHNVKVFLSASADIARNKPSQPVIAQKIITPALSMLKAGTVEQPVLQKKGDDLRIDWGYMYIAAPKSANALQYTGSSLDALS